MGSSTALSKLSFCELSCHLHWQRHIYSKKDTSLQSFGSSRSSYVFSAKFNKDSVKFNMHSANLNVPSLDSDGLGTYVYVHIKKKKNIYICTGRGFYNCGANRNGCVSCILDKCVARGWRKVGLRWRRKSTVAWSCW